MDGDATLAPRIHGGLHDAELGALGLDPLRVVDFSVNTNPYGPCPAVVAAIRAAPIDRYPDPTSHAARRAIAPALGVAPEAVVLGDGATELLWTIVRAVLRPGATALVAEPAFAELAAAAAASGARVVALRARAEDGYAIDLAALDAAARRDDPALVYLCTPSSPTGAGLPAAEVAAWARRHPTRTIVVDQSFLSLSERAADAEVAMPDHVVRVRSLTKDHAIPGVRVGLLLAAAALARRIEAARPAWTVGAIAQAAAVAAVHEPAFVVASRARLLVDRARLVARLAAAGYHALPSTTIFVAVPHRAPATLRARLLARHQILVRDCASFGLPGLVRVAARPAADVDRLLAALADEAPC